MLFAVLATALFACSAFYAVRATASVGPERAALARILIAVVVLGAWAFTGGCHIPLSAALWLLLSGVIGMGLGDIVFFQGIPLVGGRLMTVLGQCLSAPLALAIELAWLGTWPDRSRAVCVAVILVGVALSLSLDSGVTAVPTPSRRRLALGRA